MAISSDHVIKEVSKKLKYYFDIKRLEDGFDLSGPACPRLDHPPTKARPTLQYDGLHDRPLKHYFSPQQVKSALTQFKAPQGKNSREKEIRKQLERYFKRYQFNENIAHKETRSLSTPLLPGSSLTAGNSKPKKSQRTRSAKTGQTRSQHPVLSDGYYNVGRGGNRKLRPEASGGFGVGLKKRKGAFAGGRPQLRSAPPTSTSKHEADRLVNIASRLLVATETIDLQNPQQGKFQSSSNSSNSRPSSKNRRENDDSRGAPRNFESGRGRHAIYTYDINGRKLLVKKRPQTPPRSPTPPGNYVTINGDAADDQVMPRWLRKKVAQGGAHDPDRPQSAAYTAPALQPSDEEERPQSATGIRLKPKKGSSESIEQPRPVRQGWGSDADESGKSEAGVQTGGELLKNFDPTECILEHGEEASYEVHVFTGSRLGASTKADVKIALFGDKGRTHDIYLEKSLTYKIKFQKGQEDIFRLETFYVGPIQKIAIGHDRSELGFGWYLEKVEVRDLHRHILYNIPCERWLSSQDSEKLTYRQLGVSYSTTFKPEEKAKSPEPDPEPEPLENGEDTYRSSRRSSTDSNSNVSMATLNSSRSSYSSRGKRTSPRSRSYTSQSSDYTSSTVTSARPLKKTPHGKGGRHRQKSARGKRSSRSSSPSSTPRKVINEEDEERDDYIQDKEDIKPKPPPQDRMMQRRDTFFDQPAQRPGTDYTNVIDNLSTTTEDRRNSSDFDLDKSGYEGKDPKGKPLAIIEDDETARLDGDPEDQATDKREAERLGARLTAPSPREPSPPPERAGGVYLDGFKAGMEAAKTKETQKVTVDQSDSESDTSDIERGPSIHDAAKNGDLSRVKKLLEKNSSKKDSVDERGWAPVHIAAAGGHTDIIKWLAVTHADLNVETPTSYTAMHLAAMHGHTNTMIVLFAMGAKLASKSVEQQTPLHVGASGGHLESVKWLVANRAPIDGKDNLGRTAHDLAKEYDHQEVAEFLGSCQKEQQRPGSGLSLIRTGSKQRAKSAPATQFPPAHKDVLPCLTSEGKKSYTSYSTDTLSTDSESDEDPGWRNDNYERPKTSMGRRSSTGDTSDTESKKDVKHDEELMEKRHAYQEHQRRMSEKNVSFLDAIRDEAVK